MISFVCSAAVHGVDGYPVTVEVDLRAGLPSFSIVGLPDAAVRESKERVIAAIKNSGFTVPPNRITINLAPAHIRKEGPAFDLPMAIGLLAAAGLLTDDALADSAFMGELGLSGDVRAVRGVLPCVIGLKNKGVKKIFVPAKNAAEAALVEGVIVTPVADLIGLVRFLTGEITIEPVVGDRRSIAQRLRNYSCDFSDVKGQRVAKRALEVAAAGNHNLLLIGPPGSGKTLLARRFQTILPEMEFDEALEATKIHSVAGVLMKGSAIVEERPFRSPHHQMSAAALIGGGANPRPGEVSLAHRGVLFLDEFPEFGRHVLEGLRQPLEDRYVTVVRVSGSVRYPSEFLLIAAANPCPCGYLGSMVRACTCTPHEMNRYRMKFSGPLLDRIDLHVEVPALKIDEMTDENPGSEASAPMRERVKLARQRQQRRYENEGIVENGQLSPQQIRRFCIIDAAGKELLREAIKKLGLSARAFDRILRVARTIADLEASSEITKAHLAEAIGYRALDRDQNLSQVP